MILSIKNWLQCTTAEQERFLTRPALASDNKSRVLDIIKQVQTYGDSALLELTRNYDGATLRSIQLPEQSLQKANISQQALSALNLAVDTITQYHQSLVPEESQIATAKGICIRTTYRPIQRVGLYVPGGNNTPLVSSLLMQAIPALVAGCPIKVLCTPPNASGEINPHLLVAARLCGIETIYTIGGAQAIAAMAYGTESVIKTDKIFGPGNSYVTEAKTYVSADPQGAAIDMPAGPSEVMILADTHANPAFVAADLLAQAEHGADSQVYLICDDAGFAEQVNQEVTAQWSKRSRKDIIQKSLAHSMIIVCPNTSEQIKIINRYTPEHLIIQREDAAALVKELTAVGTVFLGPWAAETMGDYVTGSCSAI